MRSDWLLEISVYAVIVFSAIKLAILAGETLAAKVFG